MSRAAYDAAGVEATGVIDLGSRRLGGMVLDASDEFFAPKENLLEPHPPVFEPGRYTDRGKAMDGWETRRRRDGGHDWAVVRLGVPGVVETAVVDTTHFRGNQPQACALEGCVAADGPPQPDAEWFPLLGRTDLAADAVQRVPVAAPWRVTHVRLSIFPDGGIARLRLEGRPLTDLRRAVGAGDRVDLAAAVNGGVVVCASDATFATAQNLVMVGDARDMGDGWETRRRRGGGHDWAVVALAATGVVERVEVDTTHYKGNYPQACAVDVAADPDGDWTEVVAPQPLQPHARHAFAVADAPEATHLRLRVLPDGGVARLRAYGVVTGDGWRRHGLRLLNARTPAAAEAALLDCCGSTAWAQKLAARRPFADPEALLRTADEVWAALGPDDWREAFTAHPRIGERAQGRSAAEQAGTAHADAATLKALAEGNRAYEQRFGHVFLIRAAGRSAGEMLAALRERLTNDPDTELRVAAGQQAEITRLRLAALLSEARP